MGKKIIAVLGAGSWGSALAIRLALNGHDVRLCCYDDGAVKGLKDARVNQKYLPDISLPDNISIHNFDASALSGVDYILVAMPSVGFAQTIDKFKSQLLDLGSVIWATKGFDESSGLLLSDLVAQKLSPDFKSALITGPSFAKEVAKGLPSAVSVAASNTEFAQSVRELFHSKEFRTYICDDFIGAQVGGALKNVIAIATGLSDGLGYGANARAALITRGLAETQRLGVALGAGEHTFSGLTGMGDLVLTCTDDQSRNRRFGLYLGAKDSIDRAIEKVGQVVEGYETVKIVYLLSKQHGVSMPITDAVYSILYQSVLPVDAVKSLLSRKVGLEDG